MLPKDSYLKYGEQKGEREELTCKDTYIGRPQLTNPLFGDRSKLHTYNLCSNPIVMWLKFKCFGNWFTFMTFFKDGHPIVGRTVRSTKITSVFFFYRWNYSFSFLGSNIRRSKVRNHGPVKDADFVLRVSGNRREKSEFRMSTCLSVKQTELWLWNNWTFHVATDLKYWTLNIVNWELLWQHFYSTVIIFLGETLITTIEFSEPYAIKNIYTYTFLISLVGHLHSILSKTAYAIHWSLKHRKLQRIM